MKKFYILMVLLFLSSVLKAQTEYVDIYNPVYNFLERMENNNIISGYNSYEVPKTRNEVAGLLKIVRENESLLTGTDKEILTDLETEFEYELRGTTTSSRKLIGNDGYSYFSDNQKYLYYNTAKDFNIFINLVGEYSYLHEFKKNYINNNASLGDIGGIIRGSINDKFGFYLKGTNGNLFGSKTAALSLNKLAQNFKFTEKPEETFFDETEGYITADFNFIKLKLGRDRIKIGYSDAAIVDDFSPAFDYMSLKISYEFFSYSYLHAKMLDIILNPGSREYADKFLVYHRIGFNISRHLDFGAGEFVIYGRRGIDLSYLNPFAFFKTIEHANRDRDNTMLFFDINNNSIPGTKLYLNFLIDDISYGKLGTGWWGNQVMTQVGFSSTNIGSLPLDISGLYRRTEPYVFTHKYSWNKFANFGYALGSYNLPNSDLLHFRINYRLNYRLEISTAVSYIRHGANSGGSNFGGDINMGHRENDPEKIKFLDGAREYYRNFEVGVTYEPFNQIIFRWYTSYSNDSILAGAVQQQIQSLLTLTTYF